MGVIFAALKRDPDGHLAERAPRQGKRPAQALRAQDDMYSKCTTLANQAVEP